MKNKIMITFGMCCFLAICSACTSGNGKNDNITGFKQILNGVDLDIDLMQGFGLSNNTVKELKPLKATGNRVNDDFNPDEYLVHHIEDEKDWNIYASVINFQNSLNQNIKELTSVVEAVSKSANSLGNFNDQGTTYKLSMLNETTGLISFIDTTPQKLQSRTYNYDNNSWETVTLASWTATSYDLYFEENEYTFHTKAHDVTMIEGHENYSLMTAEYFDRYIRVEKEESGDYLSVTAIINEPSNYDIMRTFYQMYKKEDVVYYISSEEIPRLDLIDTSFVSFIDSLVISYNARTYPFEEVTNEYSSSWPFFESNNQYFWTLQVSCGTVDGLKVYPEYDVDTISAKLMDTVQTVYYTSDWADAQYDPSHISSYPAPDWLYSFLGCPMRAIVTSGGTFEGIQNGCCYIDSLAVTGKDGVFHPGRNEIAGIIMGGLDNEKLYGLWSEIVSSYDLVINDNYDLNFTSFMHNYSRSDLFNPEKMKELCDYDYVREHLKQVLTNYQNVFEPSKNIKYKL